MRQHHEQASSDWDPPEWDLWDADDDRPAGQARRRRRRRWRRRLLWVLTVLAVVSLLAAVGLFGAVGLTFDGNLESLPVTYLYSDDQARAVHVDVRGIVEALSQVYKAAGLLKELGQPIDVPRN